MSNKQHHSNIDPVQFSGVNERDINDAYISSSQARNKLTTFDGHSGEYKHYAKVCCFCDRLIPYMKERFMNIKKLNNINIQNVMNKKNIENIYGLKESAFINIKRQYTQKFYPDEQELSKLVLSPSTYGIVEGNKKKVGCCEECYIGINKMTRKKNLLPNPPRFVLCNGLVIGKAPKELTDLNQGEIALISLS